MGRGADRPVRHQRAALVRAGGFKFLYGSFIDFPTSQAARALVYSPRSRRHRWGPVGSRVLT